MNIAIVEDNQIERKQFVESIERFFLLREQIIDLAEFESAETFWLWLKTNKEPDLVLVDVHLPSQDGIELSRQLFSVSPKSIVVFITSDDSLMRHAFGLNVNAYLTKSHIDIELEIILAELINLHLRDSRRLIKLPTSQGMCVVKENEILFATIRSRRVELVLHDRVLKLKHSMGITNLFEMLSHKHFVYIDNGTFVNIAKIDFIQGDQIKIEAHSILLSCARRRLKNVRAAHLSFLIGDID